MNRAELHDKGIPLLVGLLLTALTAWMQITTNPLVASMVTRLENVAYDQRLRSTVTMQNYEKTPIIIIDIDEHSLQKEGRWPWPRAKIATLVQKLFENGVVVIAFDILFTEAQDNIAAEVLNNLDNRLGARVIQNQYYEALLKDYDHDAQLASTFGQGDVVLGFLLHNEASRPVGALPEPTQLLTERLQEKLTIKKVDSYTGNLPMLQQASLGGGFTTSIRDTDGVVRRSPMVMRYQDKIYPSLALTTAQVFLLAEKIELDIYDIGPVDVIESVKLDRINIPTDAEGKVLVPFHGRRGYFNYISATDILSGNVKAEDVEGKIAMVGTSALGLADLHSTAIQAVFPGVEVHANILAGILQGKFPTQPAWTQGANFLWLLVSGIILSSVFAFVGPTTMTVIGSSVIIAEVALNFWIWLQHGLVLDIVLPIFLVVVLIICNLTYGFLFANRRKKEITSMFGQYVSADLVEEMSKDPANYSFDGQSKPMTVLFADIRSFTSISESLTAKELKDLLNRYFEPMTEIIFTNSGTIDKYVGDMIMAFWGAPKPDPHQEQNAVEAAFQMQEKTFELKKTFKALGLPEVNIGIGLNSGIMNVGDMGSKYRRAYTVLGDNVNLASRFEASTKFYGAKILIGEKTHDNLHDFVCRKVDLVRVKGKKQAVPVYEPLLRKSDLTPEITKQLEQYDEGLKRYQAQDWDKALQLFQQLLIIDPDSKLFLMYAERIREYMEHPPGDDWDGSYTRTDK